MRSGCESSVADLPLFVALLGILTWAPLPLASNRTWAVGVLLLLVLALWTGVALVYRCHADLFVARLRVYQLPLWLMLLIVIYTCWQSISLPMLLVDILSSEAGRLWRTVDPKAVEATVSIDPEQTRLASALAFIYLSVFTFVVLLVRSRERLIQFAYTVIACGLFQALLGGLLFSMRARYEILTVTIVHETMIGTFVNRDHFAGYIQMCLSVGIGMTIAQLHAGAHRRPRRFIVRALEFVLSAAMRTRMMLAIMVIALVLTRSRMGNLGFLAAMLAASTLYMLLARDAIRSMGVLLVSLLVVDVLVIGQWVGLDKLTERLEKTFITTAAAKAAGGAHLMQSVEERTLPAEFALRIVRDFPLTGSGGGSFYTVFPRYRQAGINGYYDHAHNDYLELLTDYGLLGSSLFAVVVLLTLWKVIWVIRYRSSRIARGMSLGVLMAILALMFHSTVDFNLQIPANALMFSALLALGWVSSELARVRGDHNDKYLLSKNEDKCHLSKVSNTGMPDAMVF